MGSCGKVKDQEQPTIICFYELGDDSQKEYCLKLRDNFTHSKTVKYEIKCSPGVPFCIKFKMKNKTYDIQNNFENNEQALKQSLEKIYKILDEN